MPLNDLGLEELRSALWSDHDEASEAPGQRPLLAHYTSIESFEQILKNQEIWFSNPRYTNDSEELRWGIEAAWGALLGHPELKAVCDAMVSDAAHRSLTAGFGMVAENFVRNHLVDTYVFCFSAHDTSDFDGRLSMWRGYGANGRGVCAVFDFSKVADIAGSPFVFAPVQYRSTQERQGWIDVKIRQVIEFLEQRKAWTQEELLGVAIAYFYRVRTAALFTKHKGFAEEREWRLVFDPERELAPKFEAMKGYHVSDGVGVAPKLKLKLPAVSKILNAELCLDGLLERILVGPTQRGELVREAFVRMLRVNSSQKHSDTVHLSTIPYRP